MRTARPGAARTAMPTDRGLGRLDSLADAAGNRNATVNYTVELQSRAIGPRCTGRRWNRDDATASRPQ